MGKDQPKRQTNTKKLKKRDGKDVNDYFSVIKNSVTLITVNVEKFYKAESNMNFHLLSWGRNAHYFSKQMILKTWLLV